MKKGLGSGPATVASYVKAPDGPHVATAWPLRSVAVIAAAAILALALRLFQLSRPGYLSGFIQYDDKVYFGNALRLVHGAIAYRDFTQAAPGRGPGPFGPLPPPPYSGAQPGELGRHIQALAREGAP